MTSARGFKIATLSSLAFEPVPTMNAHLQHKQSATEMQLDTASSLKRQRTD